MLNYKELSASYKSKLRDTGVEKLEIRVYRSLSWLKASEKHTEDEYVSLILMCISLRCCYIREEDKRKIPWDKFIENMRGTRELGKIRVLLYSQIGADFLESAQNEMMLYHSPSQIDGIMVWSGKKPAIMAIERKERLVEAIKKQDIIFLLGETLWTFNHIRNALCYGNRAYEGVLGRTTVSRFKNMLQELLPLLIQAIIENPEKDWGTLDIDWFASKYIEEDR